MVGQPDKDPITTHVLDTITGLHAKGIYVELALELPPQLDPMAMRVPHFFAKTNADGRVLKWTETSTMGVEEAMDQYGGKLKWRLSFSVEEYYGEEKTFYPKVDLEFYTQPKSEGGSRPHLHVPLLLGPWSYTTYRGS